MSKIAIPVKDDLLSTSYDACAYFLIYDIDDRKVVSKKIEFFPDEFRARIADWYSKPDITDIIVHFIDESSLYALTSTKINLFVGVKINSPDRLIEDFLDGTLKSDTHNIVAKCGRL